MLPRSRRLSAKDVERLMEKGRPSSMGALRLKYAPSALPRSRFAFIVSKKVARDAVTRNRLRRWGASAARALPQRAPIDAAISITKRYISLSALNEDLSALIARVR